MTNDRLFDIYKQRICKGDRYFYAIDERVHFDNICRYVEERHGDLEASEIKDDDELVKYIEDNYFYDTLIFEDYVLTYWI